MLLCCSGWWGLTGPDQIRTNYVFWTSSVKKKKKKTATVAICTTSMQERPLYSLVSLGVWLHSGSCSNRDLFFSLHFTGIPITDPKFFSQITAEKLKHVLRSDNDTPMPMLEERHKVLIMSYYVSYSTITTGYRQQDNWEKQFMIHA